ncbi:disulfide bond formation protein DsbA [Nocardia panacis]|uniref:Disulfide bond formation protein DsbA n=1 Tax=Nocardia panacis TaxID=2340916 RepID=A0A3A4KAM2_9NOCA|nr:thioredoxin domain-containing protein [Nocardia panacis]RJO75085.1 disulfide bond formation protein DsbA [Nocardia panacis]
MSPEVSKSNVVAATRRSDRRRNVIVQVAVAGVLIALVAGIGISLAVRKSHSNSAGPTPVVTGVSADGVAASLTDTGAIRLGKPDAKVTVRIVSDLQCPVCKSFEAANAQTLADEVANGSTAVEYNVVSFLDNASSGTRYASRAANAAFVVAAADPAKFQSWFTAMYAAQPPEGGKGLPDDRLIELAAQAGYTDPAVAQAISEDKYDGYVQRISREVAGSGITGTPTVFVNGKQVPQQSLFVGDGLRRTIDAAKQV